MHNWVDKEKNGTLIWMEFKYELTHLIYKICKFYKKKTRPNEFSASKCDDGNRFRGFCTCFWEVEHTICDV